MIKIDNCLTIKISNLKIKTIIGILEHEKKNAQELIIDAKIKFNGSKAMQSDKINDTIDYAQITKTIKEVCENSQSELLESLLAEILKKIMQFNAIYKAKIKIYKPQALSEHGAMVSIKGEAKKDLQSKN